MENIKVTVLIPVYNSEKYLKECLDSLANQTLKEIEIICINDGSYDNSQKILDEYSQKDSRIKLLNQENKGASSAMNLGLYMATGEYICSIGNDDKLSLDCLELAYNKAESEKLDMVVFKLMNWEWEKGNLRPHTNLFSDRILTGKEAFILSLDWSIGGFGICKNSILKNIGYETSNAYGDELTTRKIFYNSKKVGFTDGQYYYRQNLESITKKMTLKRFDLLKNEILLLDFIKKEKFYDYCKEKIEVTAFKKIIMTVKWVLKQGKNLTTKEKNEILQLQNNLYSILNKELIRSCSKKYNLKLYFLSFLDLKRIYIVKKIL